MPSPPFIRRVLVTLVLTALTVAPIPARAAPVSVKRFDAQIRDAQKHIDRWDRVLVHWQARVGRAAAQLQQVEVSIVETAPGSDYLSPRWPGLLPRSLSPRVRLREAHRRLQSVLRDHLAREARQQQQAWGTFAMELQVERTRFVREARNDGAALVPNGPVTYEAWARGFLGMVGSPTCDDNVTLVVTWETAESTQAWFNPLATTHDVEGEGIFNSTGVRNYVSVEQGLEASRDTLLGGAESYGYGAILGALQRCASAETTARAIRDSAWCRGCAGGVYVTGLLPEVRATWSEHAARLVSTSGV